MRASIVLPGEQKLASGDSAYPIAISNDGARVAYVSEVEGRSQLYIRELAALEPKVVPGTSGAAQPFFSPDGQWVGFFANGALQKAAVSGGSPLRICNVPAGGMGATWGPDNTIVLALRGAGLSKVSASGGTLEPLAGATPAVWPEFLPDGKTVSCTRWGREAPVWPSRPSHSTVARIGWWRGRLTPRARDRRCSGPAAESRRPDSCRVAILCTGSRQASCERSRSI